jgi:hypothetical protein
MTAEIIQFDGSNVITIRDGKVLIDTIEVSKLAHVSDVRPGMPLYVYEDTCVICNGTFFFLSRKGLREGINLFAMYPVSEYSVRIGGKDDIYK